MQDPGQVPLLPHRAVRHGRPLLRGRGLHLRAPGEEERGADLLRLAQRVLAHGDEDDQLHHAGVRAVWRGHHGNHQGDDDGSAPQHPGDLPEQHAGHRL